MSILHQHPKQVNPDQQPGGPRQGTLPLLSLPPPRSPRRAHSPGGTKAALSWLDNCPGPPGPQGTAPDPPDDQSLPPLSPSPPSNLWGPNRQKPPPERSGGGSSLGNVCITDEDPWPSPYLDPPSRQRGQVLRRVSRYPGGLVAQHFQGPGGTPPGGLRGLIYGFSLASRRRLRHRQMQIDWPLYDPSWVTLTYHQRWGDPSMWKRDLKVLNQRLLYTFSASLVGLVWRLEFQRRGAPHFHLVLLWKKRKRPPNAALHTWLRRAWAMIIGTQDDQAALLHGVNVKAVSPASGGLGRLLGYLVNEMGKVSQNVRVDQATGEVLPTGRMWGIAGPVPLVAAVVTHLSPQAWADFIARINRQGQAISSRYLSAISLEWPGFTVMGSPLEVGPLIYGLPDIGETPL